MLYKGKKKVVRRRKKVTSSALVSRVQKLERKTAGVEYKYLDTTTASASLSQSPALVQLTNMAQGDGVSQRSGDSITVVSILVKAVFTTQTAGDNNFIRCLLVQDRQTNGAIATIGDVLLDASAQDNIVSPLNLDNKHRFRVLADRYFEVNDQGVNAALWHEYKKCNIKIRYDANAGDITDLSSNSLFLMTLGYGSTGDVQSIVRIRFLDS